MKEKDFIKYVKGGLAFVAAAGATIIVENIVGATTPVNTSKVIKGFIKVGAAAFSCMAAMKTKVWVEDTIDDAVERAKESISETETNPESAEEVTEA